MGKKLQRRVSTMEDSINVENFLNFGYLEIWNYNFDSTRSWSANMRYDLAWGV